MGQRKKRKKIILGVTGSLASGKSTVAAIFKSYGATLVDADKIAHELISPGSAAYRKIVGVFGRGILKRNGSIDRSKLAEIVFSNERSLKVLNSILHPQIISQIKKQIKASAGKFVVLDAPLLIEAGLGRLADIIIVVKISRKVQLKRAGKKTSLSRTGILKRIKSQIPLSEKLRLADFIIDNSGTIEKTRKQTAEIRRLLWKS